MAFGATHRRSWRRTVRALVLFSIVAAVIFWFRQAHGTQLSQTNVGTSVEEENVEHKQKSEPAPPARRPAKPPKPKPKQYRLDELWELKSDGKLVVPIDEEGNAVPNVGSPRHPLLDLIDDAERKWNATLDSQSKTLEDAVREYERRYKRSPPKGFDHWYKFAVDRDVVLIDEFDRINEDIAPFLALAPKDIKDRLETAATHFDTYHIKIEDGYPDVATPAKKLDEQFKAQDMIDLITDFAQYLPDMQIHASQHDMGPNILGDDFRAEVSRLLKRKEYINTRALATFESKARNTRYSLTKACFPDAPAVILEDSGGPTNQTGNQTFEFIYSHPKTFNFCQNPSILSNNGIFTPKHARESHVLPLFVQCKLQQGGDIQYPSLVQWQDPPDPLSLIPWRDRPNNRLFWRGRLTGAFYSKENGWRHTHRIRLHEMVWNRSFAEEEVGILVGGEEGEGLKRKVYKRKELNDVLLDVGLVGEIFQCSDKDGTCDEISNSIKMLPAVYGIGGLAKYALDVDGNGWSGRYQSLLVQGSVVLKATVFPEWISDWLVPYYHFIPIQHDYSDLYSTMAFLAGYPTKGPKGKTVLKGGHEDIGEKIALHGLQAGHYLWRWEDMQAYMFRLLLEYARAMSPDREAMSYKAKPKGKGNVGKQRENEEEV